MKIPIGAYAPDLPALENPGCSHVDNVLPAASSYRPMASPVVYSGALDARCQGALAGADSDGNVTCFAGDASKLYRLAAGSLSFSDVSQAGGYTTASDERWGFASYEDLIVATNFSDPIQKFDRAADTEFSDLSADAPQARYLGVAKEFLIVANTFDGVDGNRPARVWWSAQFDATSWPTPGTTQAVEGQSDFQDLLGGGGQITGLVTGLSGADFAVIQEHALWRATYVGGAAVWAFDQIEGARGSAIPGSVVQSGGLCWFFAEDGFYEFNGIATKPIGANLVDETFGKELDTEFWYRVSSVVDPINKIVFWAIPTPGSGGTLNVIYAYAWQLGRWSRITGIECELLLRSLSFGYTLEQLDDVAASLEDIPFSLDSRVWTGGKPLLSAFNTSHRLAHFTGPNLAATVDTTEANPLGIQRAIVAEAWPLVDGGSPTIRPITRNRQVDEPVTGDAVAMNDVGFCPLRVNARYIRLRLEQPAGAEWQHIQGIDIPENRVLPGGVR